MAEKMKEEVHKQVNIEYIYHPVPRRGGYAEEVTVGVEFEVIHIYKDESVLVDYIITPLN